ncbi:MAG: GNAT family N-acetyltransferase, partial [Bacillota bacterium]|nr:GNAT family N-acetyltransferase [Bacillota bacterium]
LKRISSVRPGKGLDICRLVVHPEFFRRGIGGNLLRKIEELEDPELITVATGTMNKPAKELYRSLGFVAQEELEVAPGILITCFQKVSNNKKL